VKEDHLERMIAGKAIPQEFVQRARGRIAPNISSRSPASSGSWTMSR
jgi:hypothetical protein